MTPLKPLVPKCLFLPFGFFLLASGFWYLMSVSVPGCGDPADRGEHGPGDPVGGLVGVNEGHEGEQHVLLRIPYGTSRGKFGAITWGENFRRNP